MVGFLIDLTGVARAINGGPPVFLRLPLAAGSELDVESLPSSHVTQGEISLEYSSAES